MAHDTVEVDPTVAEHESDFECGISIMTQLDPCLALIDLDDLLRWIEPRRLELVQEIGDHPHDSALGGRRQAEVLPRKPRSHSPTVPDSPEG